MPLAREVIIRVLHRGSRVAQAGLRFEGRSAPPAGAEIRSGDRGIGHVTSAAISPALERPIALAYVQRDFVQPGTPVAVADGIRAVVSALPFVSKQV
jgi:glycine cleavage system aminomethyltransferase T